MLNLLVCPQCDKEFRPGLRFCTVDGTELIAQATATTHPPDPLIGQILDSRYELKKRLGEGGMGTVYLAEHVELLRPFAVKVMRPELVSDELARKRFHREARAASLVHSPHIIKVYDFGETADGLVYLAMEFLHGFNLRTYLREIPGRVLHLSQAVDIGLQVALALDHAHSAGVIHRDIKPENILLTVHDGAMDFVKVLDFGIARILHQAAFTRVSDGPPGTPVYVAPEMTQLGEYLDPAIDIYAFGITFFEIIVGDPPFTGREWEILVAHRITPPPKLRERRSDLEIPDELEDLVSSLLAKDPQKRPKAAEVVQRLMAIRPLLPSRSLRSFMYMQTRQLSGARWELPLADQPTQALAALDERLHERPTHLLPIQPPPATVIVQPLLRDLDQLEGRLDEASGRLGKHLAALLRKRWAKALNFEVSLRFRQLVACEKAEEELGVRLAVLRAAMEEERRQQEELRAMLHRQILDLRQSLREKSWPATELAAPQKRLRELEQAYAAPGPPSESALQFSLDQPRMWELRRDIHRQRRLLAGELQQALRQSALSAALDAGLLAAQRKLEEALDSFDDVVDAIKDLGERFPEGLRPEGEPPLGA